MPLFKKRTEIYYTLNSFYKVNLEVILKQRFEAVRTIQFMKLYKD